MRAVSYVGALSFVDEQIAAVRSKRRLPDDADAWDRANRALEATCDLVELCSVAIPLPTPPADGAPNRSSRAESTVRGVLSQLDHRSGVRAEDRIELEGATGRLEEYGGYVVVPLTDEGAAAANWWSLLEYVYRTLDGIARRCRVLADRYRAHDAAELATAWVENAELLEDLATLLDYARSAVRWVHAPVHEATGDSRRASRLGRRLLSNTTHHT